VAARNAVLGTLPDVAAQPDPADLSLALALADAADAITTARFGARDLHVSTKPDLTPVTDADQTVERELRRAITQARAGDSVLGEEFGEEFGGDFGDASDRSAARQWVIDPIDGTKNFVRGVPVWATLVALRVDSEMCVGVVSAPALGRRWWAARGTGAWSAASVGGSDPAARRLAVSDVGNIEDASLSYSSLGGWVPGGRLEGLLTLAERSWRSRAYGDFWSHMLVAEGAVDISCEPAVSLWDLAALQVVVEEAGGRFTDLDGHPGPDGGSVIASNGHLHEDVLATLAAR
jgi:histidinol-phosphatase